MTQMIKLIDKDIKALEHVRPWNTKKAHTELLEMKTMSEMKNN